MTVWAIGLNHHTAPVDVRGRFAFALDQIGHHLDHLRSAVSPHLEAAILSTCNRTEMYCSGGPEHMPQTLDWLAQAGGVQAHALREYSYSHQDEHAARHAFRVASGLNSMVLGEPQILGQMKDAVRAASDAGALGTTLNPVSYTHLTLPTKA